MKFVGHEAALRALPDPLPPALLLTGPEGVGKRWLATILAYKSGAKGVDLRFEGSLTMESARQMIKAHDQHPMESPIICSVVDMTWATNPSAHAVLKILEEPHPYSRFILHSDREPMLTLKSRCHIVRMGLLTEAQVREVLEAKGVADAAEGARASGGRVSVAMNYLWNQEARGRVEAILRALESRNGKRLETALYASLKGDVENADAVRATVARLLTMSVMRSITEEDHVLSFVPVEARREALKVLMSKARPALRVRGGVWTMAAAV